MTSEPRLMSGADAAAYCGVTATTFSAWVASGRVPKPLPGTRRWDRKALDLALDNLSGIGAQPAAGDAYEIWKRQQDAGEITLAEWRVQNEARKAKLKRGG